MYAGIPIVSRPQTLVWGYRDGCLNVGKKLFLRVLGSNDFLLDSSRPVRHARQEGGRMLSVKSVTKKMRDVFRNYFQQEMLKT